MHPDLGKNPLQWPATAEPRADELEKRKWPLDGNNFERLTGRSSGVTIHRAATLWPNETQNPPLPTRPN
jgi:hypothetical protein